jgi:hypothetical protein
MEDAISFALLAALDAASPTLCAVEEAMSLAFSVMEEAVSLALSVTGLVPAGRVSSFRKGVVGLAMIFLLL